MRIGLVCPYDLDVHGGVQRHVLDLAETLWHRGDHVAVLAPGVPEDSSTVTKVGPGVPVPFNGSIARVRMGPLAARAVKAWLDEGEFDVVHIHEPFTPSVSVHALWGATAPIVATFHTSQESPVLLRMSSRTVLRNAASRISEAIAVSEEAKRTLEAYSDIEAHVIPNGVRIARFERRPEDTPDAPAGRSIRMLFIGRVDEPRKGLQVLLDALPLIASRHPYVELDVIGIGRPPRLPRSRGGNIAVRFHGPQPDEFKEQMLRSADLFIAPNTYGESFGIVLIEAMAAGAAVVASDLPAFEALLDGDRFGLSFPTGSHAGLAAAVSRALDDPSSTTIRTEAARESVRRFDWSIVGEEIRSIYEKTMADSLA